MLFEILKKYKEKRKTCSKGFVVRSQTQDGCVEDHCFYMWGARSTTITATTSLINGNNLELDY